MDKSRIIPTMRHAFGCAVTLMTAFLIGCQNLSQSGSTTDTASSLDTVPPNSRALEMMEEGKSFEEYMPVQMEAVRELHEGHPKSDAIFILSQTGHFLLRHGDYINALEYFQEASDTAQKRLKEGRIDVSMIRLHGNLSTLYTRFGLYEEALEENEKAFAISRLKGDLMAVDLWRFKSAIYNDILKNSDNKREIYDSILYCKRMAYKMIPSQDTDLQDRYRSKCNFDMGDFYIEHHDLFPDSLDAAIRYLNEVGNGGKPHIISQKVLLGRAYVLSGRTEEGLEMMEQGLEEFRKQDWKESVEWTLHNLAKSYAETGHGNRLAAIYPEVQAAEKEMMNQTKINTLVGADFRYRLRDKQREVDALTKKNEQSGRIIILGGSILALGLMVGIFLTFTYLKLKTRSTQEREKYGKEISDILSHQVTLNHKIEQLNEQLKKKENDNVIDNVLEQLNPAFLSGEDETKFRRAFMSLHPHFLKKIRRDYPAVTSGDELLCMLIYLKVPSLDMAASLGISRPSLNSARYRLRKRLNLDKDTDLDSFLQSL